ncbi:hypothetical protein Tco_1226372 [Tanacetum coccineum]
MIKEKLALKQQIDSLEQNVSNQIKEKESLLKTFTIFKNESKDKESKYSDKEIDYRKKITELDNIVYKVGQSAQTVHMLTKPQVLYDDANKQALGYQNPFYLKKAQQIKPTLYDGSVIYKQHVASPVFDDDETLILERSSELTLLARSELKTSELNTSELKSNKYRFLKIFILARHMGQCKEDHESQLYDDFEHFYQHKGETIHDYYVHFAKLINDTRDIKMTMSRMQLNSKFVNNMLPELGRFVTAVKLNRVQDGRVVVRNVQGRQNRGQGNNARGAGASGYEGAQNRVRNANPGQARQIKCYNCNDIAQENGVALDEEQLLFITGGQDNIIDEDVDEQPIQDLALSMDNVFQADDCDAFDSNVDEAPMA